MNTEEHTPKPTQQTLHVLSSDKTMHRSIKIFRYKIEYPVLYNDILSLIA